MFKIIKDFSGISSRKLSRTGLGSCTTAPRVPSHSSFSLYFSFPTMAGTTLCRVSEGTWHWSCPPQRETRCALDSAVTLLEAVNRNNDIASFPNKIINMYNDFLFQGKKCKIIFHRTFFKFWKQKGYDEFLWKAAENS